MEMTMRRIDHHPRRLRAGWHRPPRLRAGWHRPRRLRAGWLALVALASIVSFSQIAHAQVRVVVPGVRVGVAPPPARVEVRPVAPSRAHVWIPGHWAWRHGAHVWIGGYYA